MIRWHGQPATHLSFPELEAAGVRHAFTTRHHRRIGGLSEPGGPFADGEAGPALSALGVRGPAVRYLRQVHGTAALSADETGPGLAGTGDALFTTRAERPLAVFTADCLGVIVADPEARVLAVAHAGWRGTVAGILPRLVETLARRCGARPARLRAAIGPSIGPCCYEVDEPVVGPLRAAYPEDWTRWVRPRGPGRWWLDLWRANADQLEAAGVAAGAVQNAALCTSCRRDAFFSYRREGGGLRLATLAVLE